jgi:ArsR family transcriptional regulator, virulence genes transcriptional regulator
MASVAASLAPAPLDTEALDESAGHAALLLHALANRWRLRILCAIVEAPLPVGAIAARVGAREALVSQGLIRLRAEGLVQGEREAQSVIRRLAEGPAALMLDALHRAFCAPAP